MNTLRLPHHFYCSNLSTLAINSAKSTFVVKSNPKIVKTIRTHKFLVISKRFSTRDQPPTKISDERSKMVILGAMSFGLALFLMSLDGDKAMALGPGGPLMEDFWDNMRRYALYALTVSTGAVYTLFLPIVELLKNPISALLVLVIVGGGIFIVSQVVTAMVGLSDFSYEYSY